MLRIVGLALVAFSLTLIIVSLFRKNEPFFNLRKVVKNHLSLFQNCPSQYIVFYGFPLLFSIGLSFVYPAGVAFYSELSIILGIFLTMLLAMMSILGSYDFSKVQDSNQKAKSILVLRQTINAIMFVVLICVFLLLFDLIIIVLSESSVPAVLCRLKPIVSGITYYLFFVAILNFLLIVKQMNSIIEFNLEVKKGE